MPFKLKLKEKSSKENMIEIRKSPNDKREYKVITLKNGLRAILCSTRHHLQEIARQYSNNVSKEIFSILNADSVTSASFDSQEEIITKSLEKLVGVSMCVGSGSFSDPPEVMGLAHLAEHLAFMGTVEYPGDNSFDAYLSEHEGASNAVTSSERTVFHYEINKRFLFESLELFSEFFRALSLESSSIDKEVEVVDNEFQLSLPVDCVRQELVLATIAPKGHPLWKFSWGNRESLKTLPGKNKVDVRKNLKDYVTKHYVASNMTLAIVSPEEMGVLERAVQHFFSKLSKKQMPKKPTDILEPFNRPQFRRLYKMIPISKFNQLTLTWSFPSLMSSFKMHPLQLFGWLVGHEGDGSILANLRLKSWAIALFAGNDENGFEHNIYHSLWQIKIILTESGMDNISKVILLCVQYIELMRQNIPRFKQVFKEIKNSEYTNFLWEEKEIPSVFASKLSEALMVYGEEYCIVGDFLYLEYDEKVIKDCLEKMKPELMNITITSSRYKNECKLVEPWTKALYSVERIPEAWKKEWSNVIIPIGMHMPLPNAYISTNFAIAEPDYPTSAFPRVICHNNKTKIWYKKDLSFKVPKAYIILHLISPTCNKLLHYAILSDLYVVLLNQVLDENCYAATMAGLNYDVAPRKTGIVVKIWGFNDKLLDLFKLFIKIFCDLEMPDQDGFKNIQQQLSKVYYNKMLTPSQLSLDLQLSILDYRHWNNLDRYMSLPFMTRDGFIDFYKLFKSNFFIEGLVQGNISFRDANMINSILIKNLSIHSFDARDSPQLRCIELPKGESTLRVASFNLEDVNSAVCNLYQLGPDTVFDRCCLELLISTMLEPLYDSLRTRDRLGYDVNCDFKSFRNILTFHLSVTSPSTKFTCDHIENKMNEFLSNFLQNIVYLEEETFKCEIRNLIKIKGTPDSDIAQEIDTNCREITLFRYEFDRIGNEIKCLDKIKYSEYKSWLEDNFKDFNCPKLSTQIVGAKEVKSMSHRTLEQDLQFGSILNTNRVFKCQNKPIKKCFGKSKGDEDIIDEKLTLTYLIPKELPSARFISDLYKFRRNLSAFGCSNIKMPNEVD